MIITYNFNNDNSSILDKLLKYTLSYDSILNRYVFELNYYNYATKFRLFQIITATNYLRFDFYNDRDQSHSVQYNISGTIINRWSLNNECSYLRNQYIKTYTRNGRYIDRLYLIEEQKIMYIVSKENSYTIDLEKV